MDADEAHARAKFAEVLAQNGIGGAVDEAAARVIREARAENERAKRDFHIQEKEISQCVGAESLADLDRYLSRYVNVGLPR